MVRPWDAGQRAGNDDGSVFEGKAESYDPGFVARLLPSRMEEVFSKYDQPIAPHPVFHTRGAELLAIATLSRPFKQSNCVRSSG
jgi:hypothetical protein